MLNPKENVFERNYGIVSNQTKISYTLSYKDTQFDFKIRYEEP